MVKGNLFDNYATVHSLGCAALVATVQLIGSPSSWFLKRTKMEIRLIVGTVQYGMQPSSISFCFDLSSHMMHMTLSDGGSTSCSLIRLKSCEP